MPVPSLPDPSTIDPANSKQVVDVLAKIKKEIEWLVQNLDGVNIVADSIDTKHLKAGSVVAEKIAVNELSAISANLGYITAGVMTGVVIQTSETGDRIRLSGNTLETLKGSTRYGPTFEYSSNIGWYALKFYRNGQVDGEVSSTPSARLVVDGYGGLTLSGSTSDILLETADGSVSFTSDFSRSTSEFGYCGVGGYADPAVSSTVAGVYVQFRIPRATTPSSVTLVDWEYNTPAKNAQSFTRYGFWLYLGPVPSAGYWYWRGSYSV